MKRYLTENWPEIVADISRGIQIGILAAILTMIFLNLEEVASHTQAALAILRDLRGEFRTAVGPSAPKETTEE